MKFYLKTINFLFLVIIISQKLSATVFPIASQGEVYIRIDGNELSGIKAGDTILLTSDNYPQLDIKNLLGNPNDYILIKGENEIVDFGTSRGYNIRFYNCRYVRFSGEMNDHVYGFNIYGSGGNGISLDGKSSDIELDHCEIHDVGMAGIMAKSDPSCNNFSATRDKFHMYNIHIHNCFVYKTGMEGIYLGPSSYGGITLHCESGDTLVFPHLVSGVRIHDNYFDHNDLDGIQVSSVVEDCHVYNNHISFDSQAERKYQMSGIFIGGGTVCHCYNNIIQNGKGTGIAVMGNGPSYFFNNLIVKAGMSYYPNDHKLKPKHGFFIGNSGYNNDSTGFFIFNNTIVAAKTDGIRFYNKDARGSLCFNNLITKPGALHYYDSVNIPKMRAYINFAQEDIHLDTFANILFPYNIMARFKDSLDDFRIELNSHAVNSGVNYKQMLPEFDLNNQKRIVGPDPDCGAYENQSATGIGMHSTDKPLLMPNPAHTIIHIVLPGTDSFFQARLSIYNIKGKKVLQDNMLGNSKHLDISAFDEGLYFYRINSGQKIYSGKLTILNL